VKVHLATTHVDRHGDRLAPEALEGMAKQIAEAYVPILNEHDIRMPLGRVTSAQVVELPDGELALEAECEYWEQSDTIQSARGDGRLMRLQLPEPEIFSIAYDRVAFDEEDIGELREIAQLVGDEPHSVGKKAAEPVATLVIAGGVFIAGSIAAGFLSKLGGDLYEGLKTRLQKFIRRQQKKMVVDFHFTALVEPRRLEVHIVVEEPTAEDIAALFDANFGGVDALVLEALQIEPQAARVVLEWRDRTLSRLVTLREDAFPVEVRPPNVRDT
jgi:hypothetical protein